MDCPSCNSKLYETDINGVQAFTCNSCSGLWMSGRALDILFRLEGNKTNCLSLKAVREKAMTISNRNCPTCKDKKLSTINNIEMKVHVANELIHYATSSKMDGRGTCTVYDATGRSVLSTEFNASKDNTIDPQGRLKKGTYIIELLVANQRITNRFVF